VTLEGGLRDLVEALVKALPAARLRRGSRAVSLRSEAGSYLLEIEGQQAVRAHRVMLALPAQAAAGLLAALLPEAAEALSSIRFASSATVLLGFRRADVAHPLNGYGIVVPRSEGLRTSACGFFSTKFPGRAPQGRVLLRGFLGGIRDPGILDLSDEALVEVFEDEMRPVLGIRGERVLVAVYRWPSGTPQMEVGHQALVAGIDARVAQCPGLFLIGAGLRGTGIPDTVADARSAARRVLEASLSEPRFVRAESSG
jgi:oxygen-dependent protoporphyrinogen oxidase